MKFFIPCTEDREDAEGGWISIRGWLEDHGLPTTERRIATLICAIGGVDREITVGRATPYGNMAVLILESTSPGLFYVCAYRHGVFEGRPYRFVVNEPWRVLEFEADAP